MEEQDSVSKVEEALGNNRDEEEKQEEEESKDASFSSRNSTMEQSFYRKQGIDFLNFQRPGTAYGSAAFQQAAMSSTATSFYSSNPANKAAGTARAKPQ